MQSALIATFLSVYALSAAMYAVYVFDIKFAYGPAWYTVNTRIAIVLGSFYATAIGTAVALPHD